MSVHSIEWMVVPTVGKPECSDHDGHAHGAHAHGGKDSSGANKGKGKTDKEGGRKALPGSSVVNTFCGLFDDMFIWVTVGILLTEVLTKTEAARFDDSILSRVVLAVATIPLQLCEHSAVTFTQALAKAGVQQGAAFAFLVCSPATNFATLGVLYERLGFPGLLRLVFAVASFGLGLGLALDTYAIAHWTHKGADHVHVPDWIEKGSLVIVALLALRFTILWLIKRVKPHPSEGTKETKKTQ